jgi:catechol 2,3-dioxygenase-like lactoylglutathione lyase family enzyme
MAKLRHVALVVKDLEASARFYEQVFEMTRAHEHKGAAVYLSDGVMNLALIQEKPAADGKPRSLGHGTNHFGFKVDDLAAFQSRIETAGGSYFYEFGDPRGLNYERKFKDPEGIVFDISEKGWYGASGE